MEGGSTSGRGGGGPLPEVEGGCTSEGGGGSTSRAEGLNYFLLISL